MSPPRTSPPVPAPRPPLSRPERGGHAPTPYDPGARRPRRPAHTPGAGPGLPIQGDDLACVMFTSGSTGRPKGILSSHR
ncbi:AMP-binding protein, partial [Streptomyces sp. NPDC002690]